jgi:Ca2+-transporting ATPase
MSDRILILLAVAATVSLAIGLYKDFKPEPEGVYKQRIKWIEGFAIIVAITVVVLAGSINGKVVGRSLHLHCYFFYWHLNTTNPDGLIIIIIIIIIIITYSYYYSADLQKEAQFRKLNAKKEDRQVKALRDGKSQLVSIYEVLVGDILLLEPGDIICADGIFLSGMGLKVDESSATGETDLIKKGEGHDLFLLSGGKVTEGVGKYVVTAVGPRSFFGKIMMGKYTA